MTDARFADFIATFRTLVDGATDEAALLSGGDVLLRDLVARDDWLPEAYAAADPARYRQYLLYRDPQSRFSVVSFVWGPGQATPVHDHRVWGLVGVLRGAELVQRYRRDEEGALRATGPAARLDAGAVDAVSPCVGDIHRVANAYDDRASVSIHVYGADIGAVERATYDDAGQARRFVSGYAPLEPLLS